MGVRSGQSITKLFSVNASTGALVNADSTPTGTLYINGTADAASVTVTNISTGKYKAAVTLPTLAVGDLVDLWIASTVSTVNGGGVIWSDTKDLFAGAVPDVIAGGAGGLVIAGSNAATTFATLTSTGTFTINGTSNVAQTGDSYARIGANGAGLTAVALTGTQAFSNTGTWTGNLTGSVGSVGDVSNIVPVLEAYGDINWATATDFATPTDVTNAQSAIISQGNSAWATATGFAVPGDEMTLDFTQVIGDSQTDATVGRALLAMEGQGVGRWTINTGTNVLTIYREDGTTVIRTFDLTPSATAPTERS